MIGFFVFMGIFYLWVFLVNIQINELIDGIDKDFWGDDLESEDIEE